MRDQVEQPVAEYDNTHDEARAAAANNKRHHERSNNGPND
jgi:hypothetical protein